MPSVLSDVVVSGRLQCWIDFSEQWQWQLYMTLVAITLFVLPALIISACYTVIVSTIWSKSKQLTPDPNRRQSRSECPYSCNTLLHLNSAQ
jgi:neuropeptide S receptor 1